MTHDDRAGPISVTPRRRFRRTTWLLVVVGIIAVLLSPVWLRQLSYFRVRRVEIVGAQYIPPRVLLDALAIDSSATIWENLDALEDRVKRDPQVLDARISRKMPGTLVVRIVENMPVALVATVDGMQALDRNAHALPIDPSRTALDLPVVWARDSLVLRMLDGVRAGYPEVFARISEVRRDEGGGLRVLLSGLAVRAPADCTTERFVEIIPVEQDLARRGRRARELDLRFRDQVVARIE
jgi:cell division protein FtsQ